MSATEIQKQIDRVYAVQGHNEFGPERNAFLFLPGEYRVDIPVGFYTEVIGVGHLPEAVHIIGNVHSDASLPHNNATCTFWRAVEGFAVTPTGATMQWAVSQAVPFRRMHVLGDLVLHQNRGWASGGWIADSLIDGNTDSTGSPALNQSLSKERAEAVKRYLIEKFNFPGVRMRTNGNGSNNPVADNSTPEGREKNRRTDIKVYPNPSAGG